MFKSASSSPRSARRCRNTETQLKLVSSHFPSNTVVERSEIDDEVDSFIESEHDPYYGRYQQHMHSKALSTAP